MNGTPDEELQPMSEQVAERMTQSEAEDVIALWARLQEQRHAESGLPSVVELAEVLGTDAGHVSSLLDQVRSRRAVEGVLPESGSVVKKPRRRIWLWSAVAVAGLAAVIGVSAIAMNTLSVEPSPAIAEVGAAPAEWVSSDTTAAVAPVPAIESKTLAQGISVTLDESSVKGRLEDPNPSKAVVERGVMEAFRSLYDRARVGGTSDKSFKPQEVVDALSAAKTLPGAFRFATAQITVHGRSHSVAIPINQSSDASIKALVENEANARLESLAAWAIGSMKQTEFKMVSN